MELKGFVHILELFDLIPTPSADEALVDLFYLGHIDLVVLVGFFCQDQPD